MSIHEDHIRDDGTLDDTAIETDYCPLEYIYVPIPPQPYFRVVGDHGARNVEIRVPFTALTQNGWKSPSDHQAALDEVLRDAVKFAGKLRTVYRFAGLDDERSELVQEVECFLSSPEAKAWRERQEKEPHED